MSRVKLYPEHKKPPQRHEPTTWFVVMDARKACIYERWRELSEGTGSTHWFRLMPIGQMDSALSMESRDRPARVHESVGPRRSAVEPRATAHQERRRRYVKEVVAQLEDGLRHRRFAQLALLAPPKLLGALRDEMPKNLTDCIVAEISEELANCPPLALATYLDAVV